MVDDSFGDEPTRDEQEARPDDVTVPEAGDYEDQARRSAAWLAEMADIMDAGLGEIRQALVEAMPSPDAPEGAWVPPDLGELFASIEEAGQRTKLLGSLSAAEALAWDRMQEAGGPDDPEAFAEFRAASEFHKALATDPYPPIDEPDTETAE